MTYLSGSSPRRWEIGAAAMALAIVQATPAAAQDGDRAAVRDSQDEQGTVETSAEKPEGDNVIVVTGTGTNISGVAPVGSEAIAIDREQILATGKTTPADVVRTLPQVRNLGDFREGGTQGSANSQQGNAINLRGPGPEATLVLVDGRRVVGTGAAAIFTEANQVPLAALERIEVVADGASAIYGSDAVAGVVNYVLRKDFEGVEASFRMSNSTGGWEYTPGVTAGARWSVGGRDGNIIASYEYTRRDPYRRGENRWTRQDLRPVGGPDLRINGTTGSAAAPGNIVVSTPDVNIPPSRWQAPTSITACRPTRTGSASRPASCGSISPTSSITRSTPTIPDGSSGTTCRSSSTRG
jgi:iron complex outermembrane receptor protein